MKLIWISDIHLNFLNPENRKNFGELLGSSEGDAIVISGDIAESDSIIDIIENLEKDSGKPVYFVMGNHDFYGSSVKQTKKKVSHLNWLPKTDGIPIGKDTVLIGVDGWGDCRSGEFHNATIMMNDWIHIKELRAGYRKGMAALRRELQKLADEDAKDLEEKVNNAAKAFKNIIIVSHVPPFEDMALYAGRKSSPGTLPFYCSQVLGDTILTIAIENPKVNFLWLSGHTHSRAEYKPCNNLTGRVAQASYFNPQIEEIINVS
jgi:Icc-related predicted phosphoesterase